ncbi:unnamed protein product [Orchesella dallaii]|uniref:Protein CIP2A n=1 Tax=Orchesella dallaii TaxID=48710 RepID=A0ABP1RII6_9HEXA
MENLEDEVASAMTNPSSMGSDDLYDLLSSLERRYETGLVCEDIGPLKKKAEPELLMQITRLCYLMESSVDLTTTLFTRRVKSAFSEIAKKLDWTMTTNNCNLNEYLHSIASSIYYMNQCVDTILERIRKDNETEFALEEEPLSQTDGLSDGLCLVNNLVKYVADRLLPDFLKKLSVLLTENPQLIIESLLGLVKATFPYCIPVSVYDADLLESLIRCIDTLASVTKPKSNSHLIVLQTYNHFFDRLLSANIRTVSDEVFHNAFKSCQIVPTSTSKDLVRNIEAIRLLKHFTNMGAFNDLIKTHLDQDLRLKLVECLLDYKPELFKPPSLLSSTCFVETLNLISTISCPSVLIEVFRREETLTHISNCIVNGDETLISKGLSLTIGVGFTEKCRSDLTKIMATMTKFSPKPGSSVATNDFKFTLSDKAQFGAKKLNTNLETLMKTYNGGEHEIDDVLSMYEMENEMHEIEMSTMRDQICQLSRQIEERKVVFSKQNELISDGAARAATRQEEYGRVQQILESIRSQKMELEIKHAKTMDSLKQQRDYLESLCNVESESVLKREKQLKQLQDKCIDLEASGNELSQSLSHASVENDKLIKQVEDLERELQSCKERMSSLNNDLAKSKELHKAIDNLLDAERRKTEIIQQVLDKH